MSTRSASDGDRRKAGGWKDLGRNGERPTDRDIDISGYRKDSIEEAGMQKGNIRDERKPRYRTGGINRHIERSTYRYIEGTETQRQNRNRKKIINNIIKQYYAEDTAIWIFLVEYLGGGECYSIGNTGVL